MKLLYALLLSLILFDVTASLGGFDDVQAAGTGYGASQPVTAGTVFVNSICSAAPATCGAFFGYVDPRWYGATCNLSGDDRTAFQAAEVLGFPIRTPNGCQFQSEYDNLHDHVSLFSWPMEQGNDTTYLTKPYIHINNAFVSGGWNTNYNAINMNGFHALSLVYVDIVGDGPQYGSTGTGTGNGISGVGDSVAFVSGQLPYFNCDHCTIAQLPVGIGCPVTMGGTTLAGNGVSCVGGAGGEASNLITARLDRFNLVNNGAGVYGVNGSDFFANHGEFSGNSCYDFSLSQGVDVKLDSNRVDGSANGTTGICSAGKTGGFELNGRGYSFTGNQIDFGNGPGIVIDGNAQDYQITGGRLKGNGIANTANHRSQILFNVVAAGKGTGGVISGVGSYTSGGFPAYVADFEGSQDNNIYINMEGGANAYATNFLLFGTEQPTDFITLISGENISRFWSSNVNDTQISLKNSTGKELVFHSGGSGTAAGSLLFQNVSDSTYPWEWTPGQGFNLISGDCYGWTAQASTVYFGGRDLTLCRNSASVAAINGAIVEKGTRFTVTGGTPVSGGCCSGTFTSSTTGTMTAVLTLNGATGATAPAGWDCHATDFTTSADALLQKQTASSATTATIQGTTISGDVISFSCRPY